MIKIQKASDVEKEFFEARVFAGSSETVTAVLSEVKQHGDKALRKFGAQFDVSSPSSFEIPQSELKAAAEKLKTERPEIYESLVYSHNLIRNIL